MKFSKFQFIGGGGANKLKWVEKNWKFGIDPPTIGEGSVGKGFHAHCPFLRFNHNFLQGVN